LKKYQFENEVARRFFETYFSSNASDLNTKEGFKYFANFLKCSVGIKI
jgi:hypothetical protein